MPHLHPDPPRIPPHLHSEQEVLAALRTLPPEAHVFARLRILDPEANRDRELDFLVLHPDLGLVIVEVKGRGVEPRGEHWVRRHEHGEQRLEETPGEQLQAQQYALLRFLHRSGVGFVPQVTRMLALPALPLKEGQGLGPDLPACRILTRDKLRRPLEALREAVTGGAPWAGWRLRPEARAHEVRPGSMPALLEALLPAVLPPPPLAELLEAEGRLQDASARLLLDHLAQNFCRGRYHLSGGPGSGKSLVARQVARLQAAEGRRVLVVAFNKALTYATQCLLDDLVQAGRVVVSTYHDLAVNLLRDAGRLPTCEDEARFFNHHVPEALAGLLREGRPAGAERWDALVVDEAQDLEPDWVDPLLALLGDPDRAPVLLLEDPAQSLYRAGRHGIGQPWRLDLNLRQHPAIRKAACQAFPACGWPVPGDVPDDGAVTFQASGPGTWRKDLAAALERLAAEGIRPEQVLVLAPHRPETLGLRDGQPMGPWTLNAVRDWWEDDKAGHLRMGTVHAFKGLEADVVIYLAPAYAHPDRQRLAYTAYSRARRRLLVLERAVAEPARAKAIPARPAPLPAAPLPPPVRTFTDAQRAVLAEALTAARHWRPTGRNGNPAGAELARPDSTQTGA